MRRLLLGLIRIMTEERIVITSLVNQLCKKRFP